MTTSGEKTHATGSMLTHLEGALSGAVYPADKLTGLDPTDGRPLLARYDLELAAHTLTAESLLRRRTGGIWRWAEVLPVREQNHVIHLGEGDTPLLQQTRLGRALGVPRLATKAEGLNPTGSFKAREMAAAVSRGIELGVASFIVPSAGNAAGGLAGYGAAGWGEKNALFSGGGGPPPRGGGVGGREEKQPENQQAQNTY